MGGTNGIRILVVEDEVAIQRGLCDVLAYHGYAPTPASTGEAALREGLTNGYDLVLLDVMLPGRSGFDVCRELRESLPRLPILMLTARGAEDDVLRGFREGRVEALLRRAGKAARPAAQPFRVGPWKVDPERLVAEREGAAIELSRREIEMLALFAQERGRIVSRRALLQQVWGFDSPDGVETRTVDMHIAKLRKKLGQQGHQLIETVRGEGYRLAAADFVGGQGERGSRRAD
jgi:two-component system response regulator RegX3